MKKLLYILAAAALLITSAACSAEKADKADETEKSSVAETTQTVTEKEETSVLSADEAADIFLANIDVWTFEELDKYASFYYYLIDLDFDGTCELIASTNTGTGRYSYNSYYKIDAETKSVVALSSDEAEYCGYDFSFEKGIKLFKNNSDGTMTYYTYDNLRDGSYAEYTTYYTFSLVGSTVTGTPVHSAEETHNAAENTDTYSFFVYENGKKVESTEDEYIAEYEATHTNMNLEYAEIDAENFENADADGQKQLLLNAYNSFSYTK